MSERKDAAGGLSCHERSLVERLEHTSFDGIRALDHIHRELMLSASKEIKMLHAEMMDKAQDYARQEVAKERAAWVAAIDDAMVCTHLGVFNDGDDPRSALRKLFDWHIRLALDPAVSAEAQALIDKGAAQAK